MKAVLVPIILASALFHASVSAENWPQFRGQNGTGVTKASLPDTWGDRENVIWKAPLEGVGASSPVIVGKKMFLTTGVGGADDLVRHVLCFDAANGDVLWDRTVVSELPEVESVREDHGYTSATPVANASRLFVFFGKSGVFSFDHEGNQLWNTKVGSTLNRWGSAASLALHEDKVLVNACVESEALVALDQATGEVRWKAEGLKESWHAPTFADVGGKTQIIMGQAQYVKAFDAADGSEIWRCKSGISWYICPQPLVKDGIVYVVGGRSGTGGVAVKLGGTGDVTKSHRLWTLDQGTNVPTPIIYGNHLFFAHQDKGEAYCVDLKSGEFIYEKPLSPNPGQIYASPILAGDKIVYLGRGGQAVIVKAGPKFELAGSAKLEDGRGVFNASPAVSDSRMFIRSNKFLYCIGVR
ncbi:MAG: outer membrane protein assembly factor BamB [Verrucomicrobiales bacterium]|jgi:outer membrane protein assembly factor BamB